LKRVFVSDCEGPISKNDNAFELAENFIPNGEKLFSIISKYDDVQADVLNRSGYCAGSTLKLILPFFKAYDLTDQQMEKFSAQNILLIADTQTTLRHVQSNASSFIVSTSYEHYIRAVCKTVDFPYKNTYCTKISLDKCGITPQEKELLRKIAQEITQMSTIEIPPNAKGIRDFSDNDIAAIQRLDQIFWDIIPKMFVGKFLLDVVTIGGEQKAEAIRDVTRRLDMELSNVMYVGDSITDVEAFKLVCSSGGLGVSFNGNNYAIRNAKVAVLSESNLVTAVIADLFCKLGTKKTLETLSSWTIEALKGTVDEILIRKLTSQNKAFPKVQIVTAENMESLIKESTGFRKKVRGVAVGRLG